MGLCVTPNSINGVPVEKPPSFLWCFSALPSSPCCFPCGPPEIENRDLTKFPAFSAPALARGDYTQGIDTWFADTFPLRDVFRQLNNWVESLYGIKTVEIVGNVEQGDEIPDAPFTGE